MSLLRRILAGGRETDRGRPGYYIEGDGLLVYRAVQAGPLVPVGSGGGGAVVGLMLGLSDPTILDLTGPSHAQIPWDQAFDNPYNANPIASLPDGLGLDVAFDGSYADITALEDGAWAFSVDMALEADATFAGWIGSTGGIVSRYIGPGVLLGAGQLYQQSSASEVIALTSGAVTRFTVAIETAPTSSPYSPDYIFATIVRIA